MIIKTVSRSFKSLGGLHQSTLRYLIKDIKDIDRFVGDDDVVVAVWKRRLQTLKTIKGITALSTFAFQNIFDSSGESDYQMPAVSIEKR